MCSARSLGFIERAVTTNAAGSPTLAEPALTLMSALRLLQRHPLVGRRIAGEIRELAIGVGAHGFIALYRYHVPRDEVRILALRSQRELGHTA